jgi:pseudouridine-5'-phosphate glycosidase
MMSSAEPDFRQLLEIPRSIEDALAAGRPVVALESTVLTHGLPRPTNLEIAGEMEGRVREAGAHPATIGVVDGRLVIGLDQEALRRLCLEEGNRKLNARDLAPAVALGWTGGTTVSATMTLAAAAGIRVFATGGIGGVHRGASGDVSSDLTELGRIPVAVVCSGAKAILDLPRTIEWLETAGVPVLGWRTDTFPEFFARGGSLPVSARVDALEQAAAAIHAQLRLGRGILVCVPCPEAEAVDGAVVDRALARAEAELEERGLAGKDVTPFLLGRVADLTSKATLRANLALLRNNAGLAADLAVLLAKPPGPR